MKFNPLKKQGHAVLNKKPSPLMNSKKQVSTAWFKSWFNEDYLELYRHRNALDAQRQIKLIIKTLHLKNNPHLKILDVGCGYGRHVAELRQAGLSAEGIDLSKTLVDIGKKKYPHLPLQHMDMRSLPPSATYNVLLSLFTSFGYFATKKENFAVFEIFYNALAPNGIFWFDFMNTSKVLKNLPTQPYVKTMPSGRIFTETITVQNEAIIKNIRLQENKNSTTTKQYREEVLLLKKEEILDVCQRLGFQPLHMFGNYNGEDWHENSDRLILIFKK